MKSSAREQANRRNAQKSTGPRTPVGKARVAQNALRHGLNVPVAMDPSFTGEIERLTGLIVGSTVDPFRLQGARRIAEAQLDVLRVRRARVALLANFDPRSLRGGRCAGRQGIVALKHWLDSAHAVEGSERLIETPGAPDAERTLEGGVDVLAQRLAKLDRYERRALSRRNTAIREFGENAGNLAKRQSF